MARWPLPPSGPEPSPGPEWTSSPPGRLGPDFGKCGGFPFKLRPELQAISWLAWGLAQSSGFFEEVDYPEALEELGVLECSLGGGVFWHFTSFAFVKC